MKKIIKEGESAVCPFCGQANMLSKDVAVYTDEEEVMLGAWGCSCGEAFRYRAKEKNKKKVPSLINNFSDFCEKKGVTIKVEAINTIQNAANSIIEGDIDAISMSFKEVTLKLKLNKESDLMLSATHKDKYEQMT